MRRSSREGFLGFLGFVLAPARPGRNTRGKIFGHLIRPGETLETPETPSPGPSPCSPAEARPQASERANPSRYRNREVASPSGTHLPGPVKELTL